MNEQRGQRRRELGLLASLHGSDWRYELAHCELARVPLHGAGWPSGERPWDAQLHGELGERRRFRKCEVW